MAKNNKTVLTLTLVITASLLAIAASLIWIGSMLMRSNSGQTTSTAGVASQTTNNPSSPATASKTPERKVDYNKLQEYLQQKDWRAADRETYERMLEAAGPKARARGMIPQDEMDTLSCDDLKTIDSLWSEASDGELGFSAQQNLLRALGDYRKMYAKVGWQAPSGEWIIEWNYNLQPKRIEYNPAKEPNFKNPPPGHLPTVERGYNFDVSLNAALKRCGF